MSRHSVLRYLRIWGASMRYSITRQMLFRVDFAVWFCTELLWMGVNLLMIEVLYGHVQDLAGWTKHEMLLLMGISMMQMRLFTGLFLTNLYEFGRSVRMGTFDFFLVQPGRVLFMISTRKTELDGVLNFFLACGITAYAAAQIGLSPGAAQLACWSLLFLAAFMIHYSVLLLLASTVFWVVNSQGVEHGYFTLFEFSRLPKQVYRGLAHTVFVWVLPVVVVTAVPAEALLHGPAWGPALWLVAAALAWFVLAVWVFHLGLRRYASASS